MSNTPDPGERGRLSSPRKTAVVLRLLRGEDLEVLSRERGTASSSPIAWTGDIPSIVVDSPPRRSSRLSGRGSASSFL
jgi:hypothetical protein